MKRLFSAESPPEERSIADFIIDDSDGPLDNQNK
jgi:hypothetical protein